MEDLSTLSIDELRAKANWHAARNDRFGKFAAYDAELQRRFGGTEEDPVHNVPFDENDDVEQNEAAEQRADDSFTQDEVPLDAKESRSVVHPAYRRRYAERGNKRGCGDWLHRLLDELCLVQGKLDVAFFESLLTANSVKHEHWNRTTPGWQGRLRMSGRVALAGVLKRNGFVATPEGMRCAP